MGGQASLVASGQICSETIKEFLQELAFASKSPWPLAPLPRFSARLVGVAGQAHAKRGRPQ